MVCGGGVYVSHSGQYTHYTHTQYTRTYIHITLYTHTHNIHTTHTARKEKIRSNKKKVGIELQRPDFESGLLRVYEYDQRIPPTAEEFHNALQDLYTQHDAQLPVSQIFEKAPLDLYVVFKLVAARGGYAAATAHKYVGWGGACKMGGVCRMGGCGCVVWVGVCGICHGPHVCGLYHYHYHCMVCICSADGYNTHSLSCYTHPHALQIHSLPHTHPLPHPPIPSTHTLNTLPHTHTPTGNGKKLVWSIDQNLRHSPTCPFTCGSVTFATCMHMSSS